MGFHFEAEGEVGARRSKIPNVGQHSYNYHAILYSMSCKDLSQDQGPQIRRSAPAITRRPVPPRQSSLPVLAPNHLQQRSTSSGERHSESSMNGMLPLQIQAGVKAPAFDFSSWIESTIEEPQHLFSQDNSSHKSGNDYLNDVPWMQEEQDPIFTSLRPRKYRETPIYSDPGSAPASFSYCGCEGLGSTQYHGHVRSASADHNMRPPSPIFSKSSPPRCNGATLINVSDSHSAAGSPDTCGRPQTRSSATTHSKPPLKREGERASDAAWMKPVPAVPMPVIGTVTSPKVFVPTETEGCPSMPSTPGFVLDAHTARPSSAKAPVAEFSPTAASPHISPRARVGSDASSSSLALPMLEPLEMDDLVSSTSRRASPMDTLLEPRAMGKITKLSPDVTTPATAPASSTVDLIPPHWGISSHSLAHYNSSGKRPFMGGKLSPMAISGIVADITASVQEFPAKMLCLDTPCIVAIRRDIHAERTASISGASSGLSSALGSLADSMIESTTDNGSSTCVRRNSSLRRSRGVNKLHPAPLPRSLRADTPPPSRLNSSTESLLRPDRYSSATDMLSYYREDLSIEVETSHQDAEQFKCPDISAIAAIFPDSNMWWQSTLYAHLIAYNYITSLHTALPSQHKSRGRLVPDKAARTMGIPSLAMIGIESDGVESGYMKVLGCLEKCMVSIMKTMMGKREMVSGLSSPGGELGRGELALVRALSQVVKIAEV